LGSSFSPAICTSARNFPLISEKRTRQEKVTKTTAGPAKRRPRIFFGLRSENTVSIPLLAGTGSRPKKKGKGIRPPAKKKEKSRTAGNSRQLVFELEGAERRCPALNPSYQKRKETDPLRSFSSRSSFVSLAPGSMVITIGGGEKRSSACQVLEFSASRGVLFARPRAVGPSKKVKCRAHERTHAGAAKG